MIEKGFERLMRLIERVLAAAFVFAVCLNFVNVIGRYVFARTLAWGDEVQVYIMVGMTFLGAAVVTWRNLHLRMDVLVKSVPVRIRVLLVAVELLVILALAAFVLVQSTLYAGRIFSIAQTSDIGIPMWIPHSVLPIGFGLIALVTLWRAIEFVRRAREGTSRDGAEAEPVSFALGVLPVALLLLGFPIFIVLLAAVTVALIFYMHLPLAALHQNLFGGVNAFALLAVPYFIYAGELMGRGSVAQRLVDFVQAGVGSVRGSLGVTTVGTSAIFGAISGRARRRSQPSARSCTRPCARPAIRTPFRRDWSPRSARSTSSFRPASR